MKQCALLAPFLFSLASLLQLNLVASIVVSPDQILRPLMVVWILLFLLLWPAYKIAGDWNWAGLLLTIFVAGFGSSFSFFSTVLLSTILVGVIWLSFVRIRRARANIMHLMCLLSGISAFYIGYSVLLLGQAFSRIPWDLYWQKASEAKTFSLDMTAHSVKRDVYFIVLDGYARADILQEMYGFDNSEFLTYLEERNFVVPRFSVSNYPATHLSVASMLNMDYIEAFAPDLAKSYNRWLMEPFIDHSRVRALLEAEGYTTVSMSTNWSITDNATTDVYFNAYPLMLNDFEGFMLDSTALKLFEPFLDQFASVPSFKSQRKIISSNFDTLATLSHLPGPKFVFAHIIAPHPPFVFDRNGNPVDAPYSFSFKDANEYPGSRKEYQERYLEQLQFVNKNMQRVIDSILDGSKTPPIIILQADHGSGMLVDFSSPAKTCIKERFATLAAYHLPGLADRVIPPDITGVNLFRMVFNEYFATDLPLLETRQYFYKQPASFYAFEDVTAMIHDKCE